MRSIWKGAISFGLVSIPIKLYTATEDRSVAFHQVHRTDGGRIKYQRVCTVDGQEVSYSDIAKGYELPSGEMVVLTDDDLVDLPLSTSRVVDVLTFVPLDQVDPIYFSRSYYIEPEKAAVKPYVLLRDALERSQKVAIVKVAIRTRESLATLRVRDHLLVMETMIWPDEVRTADFGFLTEAVEPRKQELTMAESLIESMSGDFDPSQYQDKYREALEQVIEAKIAGHEIVEPEAPAAVATDNVVDLMSALRKSVEEAKRRRGEPEEAPKQAGAAEDQKPARRRARTSASSNETAEQSRTSAGRAESAEKSKGKKRQSRKRSTA